MSDNKSKVSPIVAIAATSITLFSLVGIGVLTGIIPSSYSRNAEQQAAASATEPAPAAAPVQKSAQRPAPRKASEPARVASATPSKPAARAICGNCGTVVSIQVVEEKGEGSGLGAIAGGVVGGVLGHQVGGGRGRDLATVAGVAGGALAGHEIEKRTKSSRHYDVNVRMEDGSSRHFTYESAPAFQPGDPVKVIDGRLVS